MNKYAKQHQQQQPNMIFFLLQWLKVGKKNLFATK